MTDISSKLAEMKTWPTCAHLSPSFLAEILEPLNSQIVYLGHFSDAEEAENLLATAEYCGNKDLLVAVYSFDYTDGTPMTCLYVQSVHDTVCSQLFINVKLRRYRNISFTDDTCTVVSSVGSMTQG